MTITIQPTVISIIMIVIFTSILLVICNLKLKEFDALSEPKGLVLLCLMAVDTINGIVSSELNKDLEKTMGPYIMSLWIYIFLGCVWGLTGFEAPCGNFSVTLTLACITVFLIEYSAIKFGGIKEYIKDLLSPIFLFLPMNLVSKIAPIISLSMRLFANIMSGTIIMSLLYTFCSFLSSTLFGPDAINIFGVIIPPIFHTYFDLVSGVLQTFIFTTLTISFISNKLH